MPKEARGGACKRCCSATAGRFGGYQLIFACIYLIVKNCYQPYLAGLGFLTKPAKHFECRGEGDEEWHLCKKDDICNNNIDHENYRPVEDDEYIDNWVAYDKFDLLCQPKYKIGLIGSMFFAGQVTTIAFVPPLADYVTGRKPVLVASVVLLDVALVGFLVSNNIYELYVFEFLSGCTFAGMIIVGLSYVLEFATPRY